jgi:hypothetical protein
MAAQNGHLAVVEQLLRAGAAVDVASKVGPSPPAGADGACSSYRLIPKLQFGTGRLNWAPAEAYRRHV